MTEPAENLAARKFDSSPFPGAFEDEGQALSQPLDMGRVKQHPFRKVDYLPEHDVVRTANRIFGFGRWGYDIVELVCLGSTPVEKDGKRGVHVGYRCTVLLTVAGYVPVSGAGYGDATEYQQSGPVTAHELALKEAESDAKKRAFKNFGDQFGLILYAKTDAERRAIMATEAQANGEPRKLTPEEFFGDSGDRAATTGEIEGAVGLAAKVSAELKAQTEAAISAHRDGCKAEGCDVVSAGWLKKLAERIVEKQAANAEGSAGRLEQAGFSPPAGATGDTTPEAVEGAFQDAA